MVNVPCHCTKDSMTLEGLFDELAMQIKISAVCRKCALHCICNSLGVSLFTLLTLFKTYEDYAIMVTNCLWKMCPSRVTVQNVHLDAWHQYYLASLVGLRWLAVQQDTQTRKSPYLTPVSMSLFCPPVSDSPSFPSAKLEEWSAINRSNFSPASSPLVNGMDKPHLEPEAKYTQVKKASYQQSNVESAKAGKPNSRISYHCQE